MRSSCRTSGPDYLLEPRGRRTLWLFGRRSVGEGQHRIIKDRPFRIDRTDFQKKLVRDGRWTGELVHTRKDGEQIVVMSHWALDRDELGRPVMFWKQIPTSPAQKSRNSAEKIQRSPGRPCACADDSAEEIKQKIKSGNQRRKGWKEKSSLSATGNNNGWARSCMTVFASISPLSHSWRARSRCA